MQKKIQMLAWKLLLVYAVAAPIVDHDWAFGFRVNNLPLPRLFAFFFWLMIIIANKYGFLIGLLWGSLFCGAGFLPMFGLPAFHSFRKLVPKVVKWDVIILLLFCLVDAFGCLFAVPADYHPLFSLFMDAIIFLLSFWTLKSVG